MVEAASGAPKDSVISAICGSDLPDKLSAGSPFYVSAVKRFVLRNRDILQSSTFLKVSTLRPKILSGLISYMPFHRFCLATGDI